MSERVRGSYDVHFTLPHDTGVIMQATSSLDMALNTCRWNVSGNTGEYDLPDFMVKHLVTHLVVSAVW